MNWIKNIGLILAVIILLFIKITSDREGISITVSSAYAIERIGVNCDQYCLDEIARQDALFEEYRVLYDEYFGVGALAQVDLMYVNTTLLRAQIVAKCMDNSDAQLAGCQAELTNARNTGGDVCSLLGTLLGPLLGVVAVGSCITSTHYAVQEVPQVCNLMKANGRADCYSIQ
ncbi:hypothetical protein [Colwellia sp. MB02u-14]|uniref:hypothetical protein n=1 Tax=Colwellia sp. MB02u-14 TaxID=2759815 RepID=UPI0015F6D9D2|nr:hypothetical protein [Colwellia sp. MB02u-14]MBA6303882.1 hypothetical protein [Colwellia sp. MB02u-14]